VKSFHRVLPVGLLDCQKIEDIGPLEAASSINTSTPLGSAILPAGIASP
jgi:hypothetical protein